MSGLFFIQEREISVYDVNDQRTNRAFGDANLRPPLPCSERQSGAHAGRAHQCHMAIPHRA